MPIEEGIDVTVVVVSELVVAVCVVDPIVSDSVGVVETEAVDACSVKGPFVGTLNVINSVE